MCGRCVQDVYKICTVERRHTERYGDIDSPGQPTPPAESTKQENKDAKSTIQRSGRRNPGNTLRCRVQEVPVREDHCVEKTGYTCTGTQVQVCRMLNGVKRNGTSGNGFH
jgi:hypothetical protein